MCVSLGVFVAERVKGYPEVIPGQKSASGPPPRQVNSNPRLSFTAWLSFCLQPR